MTVYDYPATEFVGSFIGNPPMNFLKRRRQSGMMGYTRVAIGGQALRAPAAIANSGDADVLMGIRAEYIQASHANGQPRDGFDADALVVEPLGSHLLITAIGRRPAAQGGDAARISTCSPASGCACSRRWTRSAGCAPPTE